MSEDRDQPVEETTEEVEGHGWTGQNVPGQNVPQHDDEGDDVEAHGFTGQQIGQQIGQNTP